MSWSLSTVEGWVHQALRQLGYTQAQATLGAHAVTWLQQRSAPGVAALAQHIDFLSAYKIAPVHGMDSDAQCPILLAQSLQANPQRAPQTFKAVRQPLLLIPSLATHPGCLHWNDTDHYFSDAPLDIAYERKSLRKILVEKADLQWSDWLDAPSNEDHPLLTDIPSRELVYIKTIQHYAGTLPPREPLDGADTTDNPSFHPASA